MLEIQSFILRNPNWEELLSSPPYCLSIKRKDSRVLFKYSQRNSDFSLDIVKEARGLILEEGTWKVVAYAFDKFFNYGESFAAKIDWNTATVSSKEDGSIIKVYYYNDKWNVGTNSTIDSNDANLESPKYKNFKQLFDEAAKNSNLDYSRLNKDCTYIFELVSPHNIICCPQDETKLYHLGTRNNITLREFEDEIGVEKPKTYNFSSLNECIDVASSLPFSQEGFVIKDKNYNRVKVKGLAYLKAHYLRVNNRLTIEKIISISFQNEAEEFLTYFPHSKESFELVKEKMEIFRKKIRINFNKAKELKKMYPERKDFAKVVTKEKCPSLYFLTYDNKIKNSDEWLNSLELKEWLKFFRIFDT